MPGAFVAGKASAEYTGIGIGKKSSKPNRRSSLSVSKTIHYDSEGNQEVTEAGEQLAESPQEPTSNALNFTLCQSCKQRSQFDSPVIVTTGTPPGTAISGSRSPLSPLSPLSPQLSKRRRSSCRESFVGSYEESLLSGRMSTSSSTPVEFHSRIGVLGKGKYARQCPRHLTVAFDAVFYDWQVSSPVSSESSPYTGYIDLEAAYVDQKDGKFKGYRIPKEGQIQIIVSNSQKTVVQLYLVPYDLKRMPENTKTFLRQTVYQQNPRSLVQAVHLQIACPPTRNKGKRRLYIYGDIRLAFQNRVSLSWSSSSLTGKNSEIIADQISRDNSSSNSTITNSSLSGVSFKDTKAEIVTGGFNVFINERDKFPIERRPVRPGQAHLCVECNGSVEG